MKRNSQGNPVESALNVNMEWNENYTSDSEDEDDEELVEELAISPSEVNKQSSTDTKPAPIIGHELKLYKKFINGSW
jgi:HKD family nuclease